VAHQLRDRDVKVAWPAQLAVGCGYAVPAKNSDRCEATPRRARQP